MYVCGWVGVEYMLTSAGTHGGQEKIACPLELVLVSHLKPGPLCFFPLSNSELLSCAHPCMVLASNLGAYLKPMTVCKVAFFLSSENSYC